MKLSNVQYVPLDIELRRVLSSAKKLMEEIYQPMEHEDLEQQNRVGIVFSNEDAAQVAAKKITAFHNFQIECEYSAKTIPNHTIWNDEQLINGKFDHHKPTVVIFVPSSDLFPFEFESLIYSLTETVAHFSPIAENPFTLLSQYVQTYSEIEMLRIVNVAMVQDIDGHPYGVELYALHEAWLSLARQVVKTSLPSAPTRISISGDTNRLEISVGKIPVRMSLTQVRGIAALSLIRYDRWFSLEEFYQLVLPGNKHPDPRDFDGALKVFKERYAPFTWDGEAGLRRIRGAVIESTVDEAVLRAFLNKTNPTKLPVV